MRKDLKEKAKKSLQGKWKESIKITLAFVAITMITGIIIELLTGIFQLSNNIAEVINEVIIIIVESFLILGIENFYLKLSRNEEVTYKELFTKTNMFKVALLSMILIAIFTTLWSLLLIIPGIIAAISYSQTYFVLLDNKDLTAKEAITKSKEMMQGHKMDYFILQLSFIGWMILATIPFCIGFLWLIPYMETTLAHFYDSIKK